MSERRWAPGPWLPEHGSKSCHCCFAASVYVKTGPNDDDYDLIGEVFNEEDVNVFAAAPELYEALEELIAATGYSNGKARAALAKARGET